MPYEEKPDFSAEIEELKKSYPADSEPSGPFSGETLLQLYRRLPNFLFCVSEAQAAGDIHALRALYQKDPLGFSEHYEVVRLKLAKTFGEPLLERLDDRLEDEVFGQPVQIWCEDGSPMSLYAIGILGYSFTAEHLRVTRISPDAQKKLTELLHRHYFDEKRAEIRILPAIVSISDSSVCLDAESYELLRDMKRAHDLGRSYERIADRIIQEARRYDAEEGQTLMNLILFSLTEKPSEGSLLRPYEFPPTTSLVDPEHPDEPVMPLPAPILSSAWGRDMTAWLNRHVGENLRYVMTEPYSLHETLNLCDKTFGPIAVMHALNVALNCQDVKECKELIVSFGVFVDPLIGYVELRVGFAKKTAPDVILNGTAINIYGTDSKESVEQMVSYLRRVLSRFEVALTPVVDVDSIVFEAEPECTARLYYTSTGNFVSALSDTDSPEGFAAAGAPEGYTFN